MKQLKKFKLLTVILVCALVLPAIMVTILASAAENPFSVSAQSDLDLWVDEEIAPTDPNITENSFIVGDTLYNPVLTAQTNTAGVPAGWLAVPDKLVPWQNGGASGGWKDWSGKDTEANEAINTDKFTFTSNGLKASIGPGDFSLLMPTLKDSEGNEVDNYVYTVKATFASGAKGQFGLITGTRGSDVTYEGGTFHCYYGPDDSSSWYYYHHGENGGRVGATKIEKSANNALPNPYTNEFTLSIYHCDGMNYFFFNGDYVHAYSDADYYNGATLSGVGLYFCNTTVTFSEIMVKEATTKTQITSAIRHLEPTIRYCDIWGAITDDKSEGLRFTAEVDKTSEFYKEIVDGEYSTSNEDVKFGMLLIPDDMIPDDGLITIDTAGVVDTVAEKIDSQDEDALTYAVSLLKIPDDQRDRVYVARAYAKVKEGENWKYIYAKTKISRSYAGVANMFYTDSNRKSIRSRLDEMFAGSDDYKGSETKTIKFSVFADLHYYKGTYITPVSHLDKILERANRNNVDFVMQAGDFCNNFIKSPEIVNTYINNIYNLPVYGVLGNHDLEADSGNTMAYVGSKLTNQKNVVWGTEDGTFGDGNIAYYYYECNGFRIVCTDTNYYWYDNGTTAEWRHYPTWHAGIPLSDTAYASKSNSLGDAQREWLEEILMDAADKKMPCIVVTHASMSGNRNTGSDSNQVREIFRRANDKQLGTVLMAINGHDHTNHTEYVDGVLYFDMNTSNGAYVPDGTPKTPNYDESATYEYVEYDGQGNATATITKRINDLASIGKNEMYYYDGPLSAIVSVSSNGRIIIEGDQADWYLDVVPANITDAEKPNVNSGIFNVGLH